VQKPSFFHCWCPSKTIPSASGKPLIESDDEIPEEGEGEQEQEEEDLSTEAYHRRMYKRALPQRRYEHVAVWIKHTWSYLLRHPAMDRILGGHPRW